MLLLIVTHRSFVGECRRFFCGAVKIVVQSKHLLLFPVVFPPVREVTRAESAGSGAGPHTSHVFALFTAIILFSPVFTTVCRLRCRVFWNLEQKLYDEESECRRSIWRLATGWNAEGSEFQSRWRKRFFSPICP
jgi:hypothetical protein